MKKALRVAARYQKATEFPTEKALKEYLHNHPDADPKNHSVKDHNESPEAEPKNSPPKSHKDHPKSEDAKPKTSWKDFAKGLSDKAKSFIKAAPQAVKSFVHDEDFRKKALQKAHEDIKAAPKKFVHRVIEETKEEAHEIHQAGNGLISALRGQKMTDHQREAVKKVATHVLIATIATALTGGLAGGAVAMAKGSAGAFAKSLAKKIALKAITPKLAKLPTMEELGHAGHGATHHVLEHFTHHLAADDNLNPNEVFEEFVAAIAMEALKDLDPDTVKEALEEAENEG